MPTTSVSVDLSPIVREINSLAASLGSQVDQVSAHVGQVQSDLALTTDELRALRTRFEDFVLQAERAASVQRSETKVVGLRADLDRKFGHYSVVRRTSVGVLQAFDVGNVSKSTITSVSEQLMVQTPRYWLAPALVAVAAWAQDDRDITEKSVQEAFSRDKNKASLFFALVLRRQGRQDASVRWLRHYFTSLDPRSLTREFAVILEATSYDAFGPAGRQVAEEIMQKWVTQLRNSPEIVDAQVAQWVADVDMRGKAVADDGFPAIAALSPQWPTMRTQIEKASSLPAVLDHYETVRDTESTIPSVLEDLLDDILDQLVTEYDEEELPLKREVVYHEAVIDEGGDLDKAKKRADSLNRALEETSDVVSLQTQAAINPENLGVGLQTQKIAIGVGQGDFRSAVGKFCMSYRSAAVDQIDLAFGPTHSNYASTYGYPGVTVGTQEAEADGIARINAAWDARMAALIEEATFKNSAYVKSGIIAGIVALVLFLINPIVGVVAVLGGAAIVWLLGKKQRDAAARHVAELEVAREKAKEHSVSLYRDGLAQFTEAKMLYEELDAHEPDVLKLIDTWPTAATATAEVA